MNYQTVDFIFNKEWVRKKGVDKKSPLKARIEALRGAVVGGTSPGAISDTLTQYLLRWAGLDPEKDTEIVPMGGIGPRLAALESNRIQAMPALPRRAAGGKMVGDRSHPSRRSPRLQPTDSYRLMRARAGLQQIGDARRVVTAMARANNFF